MYSVSLPTHSTHIHSLHPLSLSRNQGLLLLPAGRGPQAMVHMFMFV